MAYRLAPNDLFRRSGSLHRSSTNLSVAFLALALSCHASQLHAQSGIRAIFWDYDFLLDGGVGGSAGLGFDHDLAPRLSTCVQLRYDYQLKGYTAEYRSAYHFADTDGPSFYMGPSIGVRSMGEGHGGTSMPVGFRMGVRGGLQGFYADLFGAITYGIGGATEATDTALRFPVKTPVYFTTGLHMGLGWDKRRNRY